MTFYYHRYIDQITWAKPFLTVEVDVCGLVSLFSWNCLSRIALIMFISSTLSLFSCSWNLLSIALIRFSSSWRYLMSFNSAMTLCLNTAVAPPWDRRDHDTSQFSVFFFVCVSNFLERVLESNKIVKKCLAALQRLQQTSEMIEVLKPA